MSSPSNLAAKFLVEYNVEASLLIDPISEIKLLKNLPPMWWPIIQASESDRAMVTIEAWKEHYGTELSLTIEALMRYLKNVFVIKYVDRYSLLYAIETDGDIYYYEGCIPLNQPVEGRFKPFWDRFPEKLKHFYSNFHNGWYFLPSQSLGLLPIELLLFLNKQEWEIMDEIEENIDLSNVVAVFHNGAGGYLCFDFKEKYMISLVWRDDDEPTMNINFWDYLDEWIVIGIEN